MFRFFKIFCLCLVLGFLRVELAFSSSSEYELDPKFGIENELRDPLSRGVFWTTNPLVVSLLAQAAYTYMDPVQALQHPTWVITEVLPRAVIFSGVAMIPPSWLKRKVIQKILDEKSRNLENDNSEFQIDGDRLINKRTGFWLRYTYDFWVVEITSRPGRLSDFQGNVELLESVMFSPKKNRGLSPARLFAAGHIHMDLETGFRGNAQLFRDFIVDLLNHPSLLQGPLNGDKATSQSPESYMQGIRSVIRDFDSGIYATIEELVEALQSAGLSRHFSGATSVFPTNKGTLELRFLKSQKSSQHLLALLTLFKARLNYIAKNPGQKLRDDLNWRQWPVSSYRELQQYVEQTGLDWASYRQMLPRWFRWVTEPVLAMQKWQCKSIVE